MLFRSNLIHSANIVRADVGNAYLYGSIAQDKSEAIFTYMQLETADGFLPGVAQLNGLDPNRNYKVQVVTNLSATDFQQKSTPGWWPEFTARGDLLAKVGLELPGLRPEQGLLLHITSK